MNIEKIVQLLKRLPNPEAAWLAAQSELLLSGPATRSLGPVVMIGGAILQTIREGDRDHFFPVVESLAKEVWGLFEVTYKGNVDLFNSDRRRLYESIKGLLNIPKPV